jgi:hypothetical protein
MVPVFRLTVFFAVVTSVFAAGTLSALVGAAQGFALAIQQQLAAVQSFKAIAPEITASAYDARCRSGLGAVVRFDALTLNRSMM